MSYVHDQGSDNLPADVLREAAAWFASMADAAVSEGDKASWRTWMAEHPDNARAWRRVEEVMGRLMPLAQSSGAARTALRTQQRGRRKILGALGIFLMAGGTAAVLRLPWSQWQQESAMRRADYRIAPGKVATTTLPDGTRIWLGSQGVLDLAYDTHERRLHLFRGDLMVETATDSQMPARPFIVETPHGRLRALGTRFSVRADQPQSRVDVFEGAIEVTPSAMSNPAHVVHAGASAVFDGIALLSVDKASTTREAWSRGILAADRMRLDELAAELERWHATPIECDAEVAGLQVVGAYPLQDLDRIFSALSGSLPVRVVRGEGSIRIAADAARSSASTPQAFDTPPRRIE